MPIKQISRRDRTQACLDLYGFFVDGECVLQHGSKQIFPPKGSTQEQINCCNAALSSAAGAAGHPVRRKSVDTESIFVSSTISARLGSRRPCSYIPMALGLIFSFSASCFWFNPFALRSAAILFPSNSVIYMLPLLSMVIK